MCNEDNYDRNKEYFKYAALFAQGNGAASPTGSNPRLSFSPDRFHHQNYFVANKQEDFFRLFYFGIAIPNDLTLSHLGPPLCAAGKSFWLLLEVSWVRTGYLLRAFSVLSLLIFYCHSY
jgi:hypothetical protein